MPELARAMDFTQGLYRIFLRDATIEHIVCYNCSKSLRQYNKFFASFCPVFLQLARNYLLRCYGRIFILLQLRFDFASLEYFFCYNYFPSLHHKICRKILSDFFATMLQ
jgi:hypothetical protein